nr:MAG TPA: hypothetical protein [Caudoviricetes sp.]
MIKIYPGTQRSSGNPGNLGTRSQRSGSATHTD